MISKFIFNEIKNKIPSLTSGNITNIYPVSVPEGINPEYVVVYNMLNSVLIYNCISSQYQLTCVANTYEKCHELALLVSGIFQNKIFTTIGDPIGTETISINDLPQDRESKLFLKSVTIKTKSKKEIEDYL